jgi:hypothetical protein
MKSTPIPGNKIPVPSLLIVISSLELILAGVITLFIPADPKNALFLGFSPLRLLLLGGTWLLAVFLLVIGWMIFRRKFTLDINLLIRKQVLFKIFIAGSLVLIVGGWLFLFCPVYLFGKYFYFLIRIRPVSIAVGASLFQFWLYYFSARGRLGFCGPAKPAIKRYLIPSVVFSVLIFGMGVFIAATKFGLVADIFYWNVPGIPVSTLQLFFILLMVGVWIAVLPEGDERNRFFVLIRKYRVLPMIIYFVTVATWGLTPMDRHFFSLEPAAPSYQPFPYSDARVHDEQAVFLLQGARNPSKGIADKPLYAVFLMILHSVAGFNYSLMTWLQILFLALIPVIFFILGEKYYSTSFGLFLSVVVLIRQTNAIVLANKINSVNPRLFMAEEMTLLGMALFAYLVLLWFRERKTWQALLCGGCIAAASLFRLNSLLVLPAAALLALPVLLKFGKKTLFLHLTIYSTGFLIVFLPWILTGISARGQFWLSEKIQRVVQERYTGESTSIPKEQIVELPPTAVPTATLEGIPEITLPAEAILPTESILDTSALNTEQQSIAQGSSSSRVTWDVASSNIFIRFLAHFLHNFSTSVLILPDSFLFNDADHLSERLYWIDGADWNGDLPALQTGFVFLNLVLVSIGLGISWNRYRWVGMIPLAVFIAYNLATSAAMNSGGRYLVPMDWVVYFYYGMAVVSILNFVIKVLAGRDPNRSNPLPLRKAAKDTDRRAMGFSIAGILCLASLIPISVYVLPALSPSIGEQAQASEAMEILISQEEPGRNIDYGVILYPYYKGHTMEFAFLTSSKVKAYTIIRPPEVKVQLMGGEKAFLVSEENEQGKVQVESIYLLQGSEPVLVWVLQP